MKSAKRQEKREQARSGHVQEAYLHILAGKHNAASLAAHLGISVPTATRVVEELRKDLAGRGKRLVSVRTEDGFHYEVQDDQWAARVARDPLLTLVIPARVARREGLKPEDREIYEED